MYQAQVKEVGLRCQKKKMVLISMNNVPIRYRFRGFDIIRWGYSLGHGEFDHMGFEHMGAV